MELFDRSIAGPEWTSPLLKIRQTRDEWDLEHERILQCREVFGHRKDEYMEVLRCFISQEGSKPTAGEFENLKVLEKGVVDANRELNTQIGRAKGVEEKLKDLLEALPHRPPKGEGQNAELFDLAHRYLPLRDDYAKGSDNRVSRSRSSSAIPVPAPVQDYFEALADVKLHEEVLYLDMPGEHVEEQAQRERLRDQGRPAAGSETAFEHQYEVRRQECERTLANLRSRAEQLRCICERQSLDTDPSAYTRLSDSASLAAEEPVSAVGQWLRGVYVPSASSPSLGLQSREVDLLSVTEATPGWASPKFERPHAVSQFSDFYTPYWTSPGSIPQGWSMGYPQATTPPSFSEGYGRRESFSAGTVPSSSRLADSSSRARIDRLVYPSHLPAAATQRESYGAFPPDQASLTAVPPFRPSPVQAISSPLAMNLLPGMASWPSQPPQSSDPQNQHMSPSQAGNYSYQPMGLASRVDSIRLSPPHAQFSPLAGPQHFAATQSYPNLLSGSTSIQREYRTRKRKFFVPGRVFLVHWTEPSGVQQPTPRVRTDVRRIVVIRAGNTFCTGLPIHSRGFDKNGGGKTDHAVIYTGNQPPTLRPHELGKSSEPLLRSRPIKVITERPEEHLDATARLSLAEVLTVYHTVEVRSFGMVPEPYLTLLQQYFRDSWTSGLAPTVQHYDSALSSSPRAIPRTHSPLATHGGANANLMGSVSHVRRTSFDNVPRVLQRPPGSARRIDDADPSTDFVPRTHDFFKVGKVFGVPVDPSFARETDVATDVTAVAFVKGSTSKVKLFVVIREGRGVCTVLPISTYGGKGVSKSGVKKSDHAIIFTESFPLAGTEPSPMELPDRGEEGMRPCAIHVKSFDREWKLHPASRVNFGTMHTIEHRLPVKGFGVVDESSRGHLVGQWKSVLNDSSTVEISTSSPSYRPALPTAQMTSTRSPVTKHPVEISRETRAMTTNAIDI